MTQSRKMSAVETSTDVGVGFIGSVCLTYYVLPIWGFIPTVSGAIEVTVLYTFWSIVRKYIIRRVFNDWHDGPEAA